MGEERSCGSKHDKADLMTSTTSQLHEEGARMEDDLVECEGEGKAMLCVTNSKPFLAHAELQGMNLMCLYPSHPQKLQFVLHL